jgi:outer membrane putative beta-barrel porin/alpha-amylase
MNKGLLACFALALFYTDGEASAQFNDARAYANTPRGVSQVELNYTYVRSNASLDPSLTIAGANLNLNQGTIGYTYYFGVFHHLTWVEAAVPLAGLDGSIAGTNVHGAVSGAGDSSYQLAMLLKGGPALGIEQFASYKPVTSLGLSLTITAPTGLYNPDKILNLSSDRWSFKPEIALSHPFGPDQKWEFDAYGNASFYTVNTSSLGKEILRQEALPGLEGHVSYSFNERIWASLDTRYSFRATTYVDGISQNNPQQNLIVGSELNVSLSPQNSMTFVFAKAIVHQNGPTATGFSIKYDYTWSWSIRGAKRNRNAH